MPNSFQLESRRVRSVNPKSQQALGNGIQVVPLDGRGQVELRVCGALAELLNLPNRQSGEPASAAMVVAEVRYHRSPDWKALLFRLNWHDDRGGLRDCQSRSDEDVPVFGSAGLCPHKAAGTAKTGAARSGD
jgi:hypothetical protein